MNENLPLGPNGPAQAKVDEWKSKFPLGVWAMKFNENKDNELVVVYRAISWIEYKDMIDVAKKTGGEEPQAKLSEQMGKAVLWPEGYQAKLSQFPAGVPGSVSDAVSLASGFAGVSEPKQL